MSEIVILADMMGSSFASQWIRIANTSGHDRIQIHDRFREQGFGEGAEEIEVEGVDFSPIGGASRIYVRRAANNTKAEIHRAGCVFLQTNLEREANVAVIAQVAEASAQVVGPVHFHNGIASDLGEDQPVKRGRGRPKGSPNKPKQPLVPTWPGMNS